MQQDTLKIKILELNNVITAVEELLKAREQALAEYENSKNTWSLAVAAGGCILLNSYMCGALAGPVAVIGGVICAVSLYNAQGIENDITQLTQENNLLYRESFKIVKDLLKKHIALVCDTDPQLQEYKSTDNLSLGELHVRLRDINDKLSGATCDKDDSARSPTLDTSAPQLLNVQ
jgi:hypothetical protein